MSEPCPLHLQYIHSSKCLNSLSLITSSNAGFKVISSQDVALRAEGQREGTWTVISQLFTNGVTESALHGF